MNKRVDTTNAPVAVGPYSQAMDAKGTLYVSGQLPLNPKTMEFSGQDVASQTRQSLENVRAIITEAGYAIEDIVKCQVFLKDMNDFLEMNNVYEDFFGNHKPARCAVEVARLPKDAKVEIDAIAVK